MLHDDEVGLLFGEITSSSDPFLSLSEVMQSMHARRMLSQDFKTPRNDNRKGFVKSEGTEDSDMSNVMRMLKRYVNA